MQRPPLPPTATQPALAAKRLAHWREELLRTVLAVAVPTGTVLVFIGTLVAWFMRDWSMGITNIAGLAALLAIRFWRGMPASMQGAGLLAIVTGVGLSFLVNQIGAFGLPWLCAAPVLAVLLLGRTAAWWTLLFVCAIVFPTAYWQGLPLAPLPLLPHPELMWTLLTLNYLVLGVIIAQSAAVLLRHLDQALEKANTSEHVMAQLALVDSLTGLPNRRALRDELLALSRQDTWEGALLFIDVDNFK
ncbi:MAG: diguanylate cyclase domain-containing protein, partial [Burkholderiaceae bacterium]